MIAARIGDWVQTYSGVKFYPLDPRPEEVEIIDIAHHLALVCRFGGACRAPYSVAQHSCLVADIVAGHVDMPRVLLTALLHDATEAYCGDMVRPLKRDMPEYRAIEQRLWLAIAKRFDLPEEMPDVVKRGDNIALATEARDLMGKCGSAWGFTAEPLFHRIKPWAWKRAKMEFLSRFDDFGGVS